MSEATVHIQRAISLAGPLCIHVTAGITPAGLGMMLLLSLWTHGHKGRPLPADWTTAQRAAADLTSAQACFREARGGKGCKAQTKQSGACPACSLLCLTGGGGGGDTGTEGGVAKIAQNERKVSIMPEQVQDNSFLRYTSVTGPWGLPVEAGREVDRFLSYSVGFSGQHQIGGSMTISSHVSGLPSI